MARKNTDNGWVLGLFAVAIIFAVGRCSATNDAFDPSKPAAVLEADLSAPATTTMYVASASLNCRIESRSTAAIVVKLSPGDNVPLSRYH